MEDRFKQFNDFYTNPNTSNKVVSDHSFFKSLVFAKINLSVKDYEGFKKKYERLSAQLDLPQKVIFLQQSLDQFYRALASDGESGLPTLSFLWTY